MKVHNRVDGIIAVSPLKRIIIVDGNSATGFNHSKERHDFWSTQSYFKLIDDKYKVDNPPKFGIKSMPTLNC
jgi:hypothetical protein